MDKLNRREFLDLTSKGVLAASVPGIDKIDGLINNLNEKNTDNQSGNNTKSAQSVINLPKGGGAVRGIGESFQVSPFTGTGNFSVPIATSPGRSGFGPELSIHYSTGQGNGPFGMGWGLSVPNVSRKTEKGVPQYQGEDIFVLSGAEDLVKVIDGYREEGDYKITRYRPRVEGLFARIEYWEGDNPAESGKSFWKITTKENITSIYGYSLSCRLNHPDQVGKNGKAFQWLLELTYEPKGNYIHYTYKEDKLSDLPDEIYDASRKKGEQTFQLYLERILYGNLTQLNSKDFNEVTELLDKSVKEENFRQSHFFEVLFDYGEYESFENRDSSIIENEPAAKDLVIQEDIYQYPEINNPNSKNWSYREDSFSSYRAGFEIRTARLCRRVLMFHLVDGADSPPVLVRSTDFKYENNKYNGIAHLKSVTQRGYRKASSFNELGWYKSEEIYLREEGLDGGLGVKSKFYQIKSLPPLEFGYSSFEPEKQTFQKLTAENEDMPPSSLGDPNYTLVDLFGTGLIDILQTSDNGYYYWRNKGNGKFSSRKKLANIPEGIKLDQPGIGFGNMSGKGQADLLVHKGTKWGYFESHEKEGWKDFRAYKKAPTFQLNDPNVRMVDLTGDGKADVMRTAQRAFVYFLCMGEAGFDEPSYQKRKFDLDEFPDVYFSDPRIRLVDMTGDGLSDMVMVHSGRIDYWPNLGHGNFGRRVTMMNSPRIDSRLDPARLFFADIDGGGPADMIYVENNRIRFWFNQSGNAWGNEFSIEGTPAINNLTSVELADILGNGSTGLLWSTDRRISSRSHYMYLDFTGGVKPNLLIKMDNNMGASTRVQYKPSTYFYAQDLEEEGRNEWESSLPIVVQVLNKVEKIDFVSKTKLVTTYRYHHGFYDGEEREFRGFAYVEQEDTEHFNQFYNEGIHHNIEVNNSHKAYHAPLVKTKLWYHTGTFDKNRTEEACQFIDNLVEIPLDIHALFYKDYYKGDVEAWDLPNAILDLRDYSTGNPPPLIPLNLSSLKEAYRALSGQLIRQEVFGLDGVSEHPYTVTETNANIKILQPQLDNSHAVFFVHPHESLSYYYERNPKDPRLTQNLTLQVDQFGNIEKSLSISYPRRNGVVTSEEHTDKPEQFQYYALFSTNHFINETNVENCYYIGVNYESKEFELHGLENHFDLKNNSRRLTHQDFTNLDSNQFIHFHEKPTDYDLRLISWNRSYFRKDEYPEKITIVPPNDTRPYPIRTDNEDQIYQPLGAIDCLALPYESYQAVFTDELIQEIFGSEITEEIKRIGGYFFKDNIWWIPSGQQRFDETQFYQVIESCDPFGHRSSRSFDNFSLLLESVSDALGNKTTSLNDYVFLQPKEVTDPNLNKSKVVYDAFGLVAGTAVLNSDNSTGDLLNEFEGHHEYDTPFWNLIDGPSIRDSINLLSDATSYQIHDLWITKRKGKGKPPVVHSFTRVEHSLNAVSITPDIQHTALYFDSLGREVQTKVEAEPSDSGRRRWISSGWKFYNNKGNIVRQFEPFYTETIEYEKEMMVGISSTLFYDPLGRVICTIHPNGTLEKVVFRTWCQESWDPNDTMNWNIAEEPYLKNWALANPNFKTWKQKNLRETDISTININNRNTSSNLVAVIKTLVHADTPTKSYFDSLGRPFLTEEDNGSHKKLITRLELDIQGNETKIIDPRGIVSFFHSFDMSSRKLQNDSTDAGNRKVFPDILAQPIWTINANVTTTINKYDILRRPIEKWIKLKDENSFFLTDKTIYGEKKTNPEKTNHRGKLWKIYDGAGLIENERFDFKGNLLATSRTMLKNKTGQVRWNNSTSPYLTITLTIEIEEILDINYFFKQTSGFDALNRVVKIELPDKTIQLPNYTRENLLKSLKLRLPGVQYDKKVIENISYNAKGQRIKIRYANNVETIYEYESYTFRLKRLYTFRRNNSSIIQNVYYTYDPIGNITEIRDEAKPIIFNCNSRIDPKNLFTYDPLYRLITAEGREHIAMTACHYYQNNKKQSEFIPLPYQPQSNGCAIGNYKREYEYDDSGNVLKICHTNHTINKKWVRYQTYELESNRIINSHGKNITGNLICSKEENFESSVSNRIPHDSNGNILQLPHLPKIIWNHQDELIEVSLNLNNSSDNAYYQYDNTGNRVRKYIIKGSRTEERIYLGSYEIYIENGNSINSFRRDSISIAANQERVVLIEIERTFVEDELLVPRDEIELVSSNIRSRFQLNNHLGSSSVELDDSESAALISFEEYYPYGGTSCIAGNNEIEINKKRYRYSGKENDDETGLYYYGARYYCSWSCRWLSCDPIGSVDNINLYNFLSANPINLIDLFGLSGSTPNLNNERKKHTKAKAAARKAEVDKSSKSGKKQDPNLSTAEEYKKKKGRTPIEEHHHADIKDAKKMRTPANEVGKKDRMSSVYSRKNDLIYGEIDGKEKKLTHHSVAAEIDRQEKMRVPQNAKGHLDAADAGKYRLPDTADFSERAKYDWTKSTPKGTKKASKRLPIIGPVLSIMFFSSDAYSEGVEQAFSKLIEDGVYGLTQGGGEAGEDSYQFILMRMLTGETSTPNELKAKISFPEHERTGEIEQLLIDRQKMMGSHGDYISLHDIFLQSIP